MAARHTISFVIKMHKDKAGPACQNFLPQRIFLSSPVTLTHKISHGVVVSSPSFLLQNPLLTNTQSFFYDLYSQCRGKVGSYLEL
jgi:hypothetical protein